MTHCICVTRQCQQWRTREVFNGKRIRDRNRDRNRSRKRNSWRCAWREAYWAHNLLYGSGIFWSSSVILLDALQYAKYSNHLHVSANTVLSNVVCLSWETKALCLWDEIMKGGWLTLPFLWVDRTPPHRTSKRWGQMFSISNPVFTKGQTNDKSAQ